MTNCYKQWFFFSQVPAFRGLGICSLLLSGFIAFYYNVLICYSLIYAISSFIPTLPWTSCDFSWNNEKCCITKETSSFNVTLKGLVSQACSPDTESPAKQYFKQEDNFINFRDLVGNLMFTFDFSNYVLDISNGIGEVGYINWYLEKKKLFVSKLN